ncbi:MAG: sigma 54-interacting transcriptional regulator [Pirellulaceae bacterium]
MLILGESGTGKEVVARAIYQYSNRSGQRFLPINRKRRSPSSCWKRVVWPRERGFYWCRPQAYW